MTIRFLKATKALLPTIWAWLKEPHMMEFWDNSQEHKDDIVNFVEGKTQTYFAGTTEYFVGFVDDEAFCFILADEIAPEANDLSDVYRRHLSNHGRTIGLDFGIGNRNFLGKGLAAETLRAFVDFYRREIKQDADTFFIDPADDNPRARRVYEKAGFQEVGDYLPTMGAFVGKRSLLMVLTFAMASP